MNLTRTAQYGLRIALVLGVGYLWFLLTFNLSQGPVPIYNMTHGYYITRWPGPLHRRGPGGEIENPVPVLPHEVEAYRIETPWLIGRTHISWFAVQMETRVVHYPLTSVEGVQEITGLSPGQTRLMGEPGSFWFPSRHEVVRPWTPYVVTVALVAYFTVAILLLLLLRWKKARVPRTATDY
jgi:hypothetical protein